MTRSRMMGGAALLAALGLAPSLAPVTALAAGPCSGEIAQLGKQLSSEPGLGAPISEPGAGQQLDKKAAPQGGNMAPNDRSQPGGANRAAGGSPGTVGGVAGPVGTAAGGGQASGVASGQIATSPEDVRRQSEGLPTTAAAAQSGSANQAAANRADKVSMAKSDLQKATDLNAKGDKSCKTYIQHAQGLMKGT